MVSRREVQHPLHSRDPDAAAWTIWTKCPLKALGPFWSIPQIPRAKSWTAGDFAALDHRIGSAGVVYRADAGPLLSLLQALKAVRTSTVNCVCMWRYTAVPAGPLVKLEPSKVHIASRQIRYHPGTYRGIPIPLYRGQMRRTCLRGRASLSG